MLAALPRRAGRSLRAYLELTKPRITALLLLIAAVSFLLARPGAPDWRGLLALIGGLWLLAAGLFALNHYLERDLDARMPRTRDRPLPSGRLPPSRALGFGLALSVLALAVVTLRFGWLTGALASFTLASYLFVYTPLKLRTPYHAALGAISGATPPLLGWAAAAGGLTLDAGLLAAMLFFWQFAHFLAIGARFAEEYRAAGVRILPAERAGHTRILLVGSQALLVLASGAAVPAGLARPVFLAAAAPLGGLYLAVGAWAARRGLPRDYRRLSTASVVYLPALFLLLLALRA
jgi:protoheme IX farnesyltransferase